MDIYYLNSKGVEYITQVLGFEKEKLIKTTIDGQECVMVDRETSGVSVLKNYPKDIVVTVDKDDNIEELKKEYNIKGNVEIGDSYIFRSSEKYIVKPLDTFDKIVSSLGVSKEYIIQKNHLKTEKLFVGQILLI